VPENKESKMIDTVFYTGGYKYRLEASFSVLLPDCFMVATEIKTDYLRLTPTGLLIINKGYAWDGPSGPVIDTKENLRASLIHDALYQLLRLEWLPGSLRKAADGFFADVAVDDGVNWVRARSWYVALRMFGDAAADPVNKKEVMSAPK
jgi:hypothetical protein